MMSELVREYMMTCHLGSILGLMDDSDSDSDSASIIHYYQLSVVQPPSQLQLQPQPSRIMDLEPQERFRVASNFGSIITKQFKVAFNMGKVPTSYVANSENEKGVKSLSECDPKL
ncbi:hypothetical protein VNO77_05897 [Canavalia gladiata]|uniref:Uncharacterized protein n=1 Tax=Canavalia gladiata TaxID=3824 RepID=A0AAN9N5R0_CANGL